jgi:hypothetical protein
MVNDGGGHESESRPSILKTLLNRVNNTPQAAQTPATRFDPNSGAITATPESDMAHGPLRKTAQPSETSSVAIPSSVEDRLRQIGSESFGYTPDQLRLAKENNYDLSTGRGKAGFASFLGRYYSPKDASVPQSEKEIHRVAKPNDKLQFTIVDNTGPMK